MVLVYSILIVFASREINTSENRAEDTRTSGNQGTRAYSPRKFEKLIEA